uniref:Uncharacterized protein n=1 Tax=Oryza nivara TaxID=4536 RepID=A0A0E0GI97_ORYNI
MDENGMDFPNRIDYRFRLGFFEMLSRTPPPPPSAPQPVAPTLLRRPQIPTPLSAASWPSAASALSSGSPRPSAGMFWEISPPPPPPPASGVRLAQDSTTHVSESTVPPRSFVDAVSGSQLQSACSPTTAASHIKAYDATPRIHAGRARMDRGQTSALVERERAFNPWPMARFKARRRRWKESRPLLGGVQG